MAPMASSRTPSPLATLATFDAFVWPSAFAAFAAMVETAGGSSGTATWATWRWCLMVSYYDVYIKLYIYIDVVYTYIHTYIYIYIYIHKSSTYTHTRPNIHHIYIYIYEDNIYIYIWGWYMYIYIVHPVPLQVRGEFPRNHIESRSLLLDFLATLWIRELTCYIYVYIYILNHILWTFDIKLYPSKLILVKYFEIGDNIYFTRKWANGLTWIFFDQIMIRFNQLHTFCHWIGLRENLQETMVFTIKYRAFL